MAATITYTLQNKNSEYEEVGLGGTPDPLTTLTPIYGNKDWSFDVVFSGTYDAGQGPEPISITSVLVTNPNTILTSNSANRMTLYRNSARTMFPGEKFRFVNFLSQQESEYENVSNIPNGLSVIGWDTPTDEEITYSLAFIMFYDVPTQNLTDLIHSYILSFTLVWNFQEGWTTLQQLVANSET